MGSASRFLGLVVVGATVGLLSSCGPAGVFSCDEDEQCVDGARMGRCEASGYCSFPDPDCSSGYRYSEHAADRFANTCIPPDVAEDATGDDGDETVGSGSHSTGPIDPTVVEETHGDDAVTATMPTVTSADDGTTSLAESGGTTGPAPTSDEGEPPTTSSDDGATTGVPGDPYGECLDVSECTYPLATCMYDNWALPVCNPACSGAGQDDECPAAVGGDAMPACREIITDQWGCVLDCTDGACPDGMYCGDSTIGPFCFWA